MITTNLTNEISAIGALGTASFGLVDATKAFWGGVSRCGFGRIQAAIKPLYGSSASTSDRSTPLAFGNLLDTLRANWMNGTDLGDQKAIAKSLLKLRLDGTNAAVYAAATGVNAVLLASIAGKISSGVALTAPESDAFGRFDLTLTALLDEGYERADQIYRNDSKILAGVFSVIIALFAGQQLHAGVDLIGVTQTAGGYWGSHDMWAAFIIGLLATPLAPVAKDLTSALVAGVKAVQSVGN